MLIRFFVMVLFAFILAACDGEALPTLAPTATPAPPTATPSHTPTASATPTQTPTATPAPIIPRREAQDENRQSFVRAVHAAPAWEAVDFYIEDLIVANTIAYGQVTEQGGIVAGEYRVRVVPSGGRLADGAILEQTLTIAGRQTVTFVFSGTLTNPTLQIITQNISPLLSEESRLTVAHAMPDGPEITLEAFGTPITGTLSFGMVAPPTTLTSADTEFVLRSGFTTLTETEINLRPRESRVMVVTGSLDDVRLITFAEAMPGLAEVRVVNAANGAPIVNVFANDLLIGEEMGFTGVTEFQRIEARIYSIGIFEADSEASLESTGGTGLIISPDDVITLIITGDEGGLRITTHREDTSPTRPDHARLIFVHAVPDVPRAEGYLGQVDANLLYGQVSQAQEVGQGTYNAGWYYESEDDEQITLDVQTDYRLQDGTSYLYIVTNDPSTSAIFVTNEVGVSASDAPIVRETPVIAPSRLRVVNAMPGLQIEFRLSDVPIAQQMNYTDDTTPLIIGSAEQVLTVHNAQTQELLARSIFTYDTGSDYSAFAYGNVQDGYGIIVALDDDIERVPEATSLRLVNTSTDATVFTLGISNPEIDRGGAGNPATPDPAIIGDFRRSLPIGVERVAANIPAGNASFTFLDFNAPGLRAIRIIDAQREELAATIPEVTLSDSAHYDVIAYQEPNSFRVQVTLIPYES